MEITVIVLMLLAGLVLAGMFLLRKPSLKTRTLPPLPGSYKEILSGHVSFYRQLDAGKKKEFEDRVQAFLSRVRITGVNTTVEDMDRVFIAASAIIPIFAFPDWEYINLDEVLLYPDSFNHDFEQAGANRSLLGIVGEGAFEDVMILSRFDLREGFLNKSGKTNTAIHEFVHLLDKTDGSIDGIPAAILSRQYIVPWLRLMQRKMKQIRENDSDIDPYGASNPAEFFAVVSEYFFERPDLLERKHPGLYRLLTRMFRQREAGSGRS